MPRVAGTAHVALDGLQAFEEICRGKLDGTLTKADLVAFLTHLGDRLPAEDLERFIGFIGLSEAGPKEAFDYEKMVSTLMIAARSAKS